jgi:serine/threonine protein kinase
MNRGSTKPCVNQIGNYPIVGKISGSSRTAAVYKAEQPDTGKAVAIKLWPPQLTSSPQLWQRFALECKIASRLDHPHIVRVLDHGMEGTQAYLVMEYMAGGSLADRIEQKGSLPEAEALLLIAQVGRALHWAHQRKLIHRDVKPDNILLTECGQAKLAGMGLVKDLQSDDNFTQSQSFLGTPHYMAPEQCEDARSVDGRCDLYSLAGTLYTALCSELPFASDSAHNLLAVYRKQIANDLVPPRALVSQLSERTNAAILAGLRANRDERPTSVGEFLAALEGLPVVVKSTKSGTPASGGREESPVVVEPTKSDTPASGGRARDGTAPPTRRAKQRRPSKRLMSCFILARSVGKRWRGRAINISETGLCLELHRRFEPGANLTFTLGDLDQHRNSLIARVMWVRQVSAKVWHLGCRFDEPLCDFELKDLLEKE